MTFVQILVAALPVFLIIGIGYSVRAIRMITEEAEKSILRLVVNVLYPCFILSKVPGNESLQDAGLVAIAVFAGFTLTLISMLVAFLLGRLWKIQAKDGLNTFCLSAGLQNYGFLPIPLIIALFPVSSDQTLGVLFVHNLGLEFALWTVGIVILSGSMKGALRRLINGPTIAIAVGLTSNFCGFHSAAPEFLVEATRQLGNCSIPIGLILVGVALAGVVEREKWKFNLKVITASLVVRFCVLPAVFLLAARIASFSPELKRVLIVESAMPAAIFPVVLAKYYGGKPGVAVQIIIATSALSLIATPMILLFAFELFSLTE